MIGPAGAGLQQADAAQDQRAHDPLAQFGFRNQQRAQPVRRNDQRLYRLLRDGVHQRRPAGQLRQFAHELRRGHASTISVRWPDLITLGDVDLCRQE